MPRDGGVFTAAPAPDLRRERVVELCRTITPSLSKGPTTHSVALARLSDTAADAKRTQQPAPRMNGT
jgi:hypothetical protein